MFSVIITTHLVFVLHLLVEVITKHQRRNSTAPSTGICRFSSCSRYHVLSSLTFALLFCRGGCSRVFDWVTWLCHVHSSLSSQPAGSALYWHWHLQGYECCSWHTEVYTFKEYAHLNTRQNIFLLQLKYLRSMCEQLRNVDCVEAPLAFFSPELAVFRRAL